MLSEQDVSLAHNSWQRWPVGDTGNKILKNAAIYFLIIFLSCLQSESVYSELIGKQIIQIKFQNISIFPSSKG